MVAALAIEQKPAETAELVPTRRLAWVIYGIDVVPGSPMRRSRSGQAARRASRSAKHPSRAPVVHLIGARLGDTGLGPSELTRRLHEVLRQRETRPHASDT